MMRRLVIASVVLMLTVGPAATIAAEEEPPGSGPYGPVGSLAAARAEHTATLLRDGRILIVGGWGDAATSPEVWDPATGTSGPAGSLMETRWGPTVTLLSDGRVLVVGGGSGSDVVMDPAAVEVWDTATGTSSPGGSLRQARTSHTATLLHDGRVLVIGGDSPYDWRASAEAWDSATGTFEPAGALSKPRANHTATLLTDGRVLVLGGVGVLIDDAWCPASSEVWDSATETFGPAGALSEPRTGHTATLLPDGRVLVIGGSNFCHGDGALASAEIWDPRTASFEPTGSLGEAREYHTATLLPEGRVLVIGGSQGGWPLASAEAWDSATGTFAPAGSLVEARDLHTVTLLPDGRVVVIGGDQGGNVASEPLASAEVCCQPGSVPDSSALARPSPSPFDGPPQRVELPEAGFAVSVPGNWEVRRYEPCQPEGAAGCTWAVAEVDAGEPSWQLCSFDTGMRGPPGRGGVIYPEPTAPFEWLELPGGRALLVENRHPSSVYYRFDRGANINFIACFAAEPPEDRWLPIATSFEFLRHDPLVVHVRPSVTLTFPIKWVVLEDRGQMAGAPGWEKVLWATDGEASCRVAYDTRASDPEGELTAEGLFAEYVDYLQLRATGTVEPVIVALPVGSAWRADWSAGAESRVTDHSLYQVPTGETSLRVACLAGPWVDAPEDRWLSLVRSIDLKVDAG